MPELDTDWLDAAERKAVGVPKPPRASRKRRPKALVLAERNLSLPKRYYLRMLVESTSIAMAQRRMQDAGYNFNRTTYWRWQTEPDFADALSELQEWDYKCSVINKSRLMLDAEKIKQHALEETDILYKGDATGHKERDLGIALRAVEFQGKGLGITDPDQRGVKVNIDIDFSGRVEGIEIDGEFETLSVE